MNVSGAEAIVAAASPWVGQGESACLVRPYVDLMTESELHLTMTSGTAKNFLSWGEECSDLYYQDLRLSLVPCSRLTLHWVFRLRTSSLRQ
jgi:hypothetical protein